MSTTLAALIQKDAETIAAVQQVVAKGQAAKAQLAMLNGIQDELLDVQAMKDSLTAVAATRITAVKTGAAKFAVDYQNGADAVTALVTAESLTEADLETAMSANMKSPLDTNKKYADYIAAKVAADLDVEAKAADVARSRRKAMEERAKVGEKQAAVNRYLDGMEARLDKVQGFYITAGQRARAKEAAGAMWALAQAKVLMQEIEAANPAPHLKALSDACDAYATAVAQVIKDESDLAASKANQTQAANNLKLASAHVLAALKATMVTP